MSAPVAVKAEGIGKLYKIYGDPMSRVVEFVSGGRVQRHQEKWALQDIAFEIPKGSALGIVGANGAGKSTLLKIISGVATPTVGSFSVTGRLGSLLELGAGFHPEFSGRDNVFMNAAIMGIPKAEMTARYDELADFADLGDYLDQPIRTYSSGMAMRLGFAVAMMFHPEILILDEVLAVGDQQFQKKCVDRIAEIRRSGTTILFVSHSIYHVRQICDRSIWIHDGRIVMAGDPTEVTDEYANYYYAQAAGRQARLAAAGETAAVTSEISHLTDIKVCSAGETDAQTEFATGDVVDFHMGFINPSGVGRFHLGLIVTRNDEIQVFTTRSLEAGFVMDGTGGYAVVRVPLHVTSGEFYVSGFLLDESCDHILDQRQAWTRFAVNYGGSETGVFLADCEWLAPQEAT